MKYEQTRLRFVLWAAGRYERPSEPTVALDSEPVVLVSMEEQQNAVSPPPKPYYRSLDDLDEGIVTLREILIGDEGFTRRRFNPIERRDEWDEKVSAGQLARDFYEESCASFIWSSSILASPRPSGPFSIPASLISTEHQLSVPLDRASELRRQDSCVARAARVIA